MARQRRKRLRPKSVGGDKGYHTSRFVDGLLAQRIAPHVAINAAHYTTGPDRRTLDSRGYRASQIVRKRIEQFFGWGETVGGLRQTRLRHRCRRTKRKGDIKQPFFSSLLVQCPTDYFAKSLELGEYGVSGGGPEERFRVLVPMIDEALDLATQVSYGADGGAANGFLRDVPEPTLNLIEPRRIRSACSERGSADDVRASP